jgi:bifunctional UDP-N-acetylglucosamine pyrophosphorylase/glucosamine-1-phosphate N-acetyltransferase
MKLNEQTEDVYEVVKQLSSEFQYNYKETAIILAAGHGKRIKSSTSKMLHKIWGVSTVERVYDACKEGIENINLIVVVGIKAVDVMNVIGKRKNTQFAYQEEQNGTGHAVQVALEGVDKTKFDGIVYVLPGDMGLIDKKTMVKFKNDFINSGSDMMVLTGIYEGDPELNYYGRIIRVKDSDVEGNPSGKDYRKVIEIMENKDIHGLDDNEPYILTFNGRQYSYSKRELIENNEFNSGVYAFDYKKLNELSPKLSTNNAQKEIYITDLIDLFNKHGYSVNAVSPEEQYVIMGFNNKSVLMEMEVIARKNAYDKLKDLIEIDDPDDFFVHESVIEQIIEMDKKGIPLDIKLGKGAYIGKGVKLNYKLNFGKNAFTDSNITFGTSVFIDDNVQINCQPGENILLGNNTKVLRNSIIKGNVVIGDNSRIEPGVNIAGSDKYPTKIGKNVLIKGNSHVFGTVIEDDVAIEFSILIKKRIASEQKVRFYIPPAEGLEAVNTIDD